MSETVVPLMQTVLTKTMTLTPTYQVLFSPTVTNGLVTISMVESSSNIGSVHILVSGGLAKNICFSGLVGYSSSTDLSELPLAYGAYNASNSYTVWFDYSGNQIYAAVDVLDPNTTISFTGVFMSGVDSFANNIYSVDKLVENSSGAGITVNSKIAMNNGIVNIGSSGATTDTVNISTNSGSGGRTLNIGNTVSGSTTIINGVIETPDPVVGTVAFNNSAAITWTNVSSSAKRIGKVCHVDIKANLSATQALTAGTIYNFFSVTPTNEFSSTTVVSGVAWDGTSNDVRAVLSTANTANFSLILPTSMALLGSTTIYASVTYIR